MKAATRSFYEAAVRRAVQRICDGLDAALDLGALAREACLAPLHFHHVFRGMVGETPLELHRRLRLERAAAELVATARPVTEIAFDAGYETHESFTRAFRRAYAASPSDFRARALRPELAAPCGVHFGGGELIYRGETPMTVTIETMPEMTVACVRHVGPYNTIGDAFARLGRLAGPLYALPGVQMVAMYHDDPEAVPPAELRSDAGLVVPAGTALPPLDGLARATIAGGRYAKTTHLGSYERLGDTWAQLMGGWLPSSGHRIGEGVSFEVYRNTPMTAPPEQLVTEIYVPVQ